MDIAERSAWVCPEEHIAEEYIVREGGLPSPEEADISIDREREVRGTYIGGFPEPERAIRGGGGGSRSPEGVARKVPLHGKFCCAESPAGAEESTGSGEIAGAGED